MRRILYYSFVCLLWVSVNGCKDDEASQPPTPTFTVDRNTGLYNSTEFTFTVDQVGSNAVSLLPYGEDHPNDGGILIPASSFSNGKAVVKFTYGQVGTFNAVVVANNHTGDGLSVKNATSSPTAITITSNRAAISDFSFKTSTKTTIDTTAHTVAVVVPFGTDLTTLKAKFAVSDFAKVFVGTSEQTSETTVNNFTSPVTYTVKGQNGSVSQDWKVTVSVTPVETDHSFKAAAAAIASTGSTAGRALASFVDNTNHVVVVYDTLGDGTAADLDSVSVDLTRDNSFGYAKIGTHKLAAGDTISLAADKTVTAVAQDSSRVDYTLAFRYAPNLHVDFNQLNPVVSGDNDEKFEVNVDVLTGTAVASLIPTFTFAPHAGAVVNAAAITIDQGDNAPLAYTLGTPVDFSKAVTFIVPVTEGGVTYNVKYKVTLTVVK
jgi:hypothetical protein